MGLFTTTEFNNMEQLFEHQLKDLYDAEQRLTKALPKMAERAHNDQLKDAFQSHLRETEGHVQRLETIFGKLDQKPETETCEAMKGLIEESDEILDAKGDEDVIDAALIAAAQRVEHYEMAGYGTARNFARRLGNADIAALLQETLDEESSADSKLTAIAEQSVNPSAT